MCSSANRSACAYHQSLYELQHLDITKEMYALEDEPVPLPFFDQATYKGQVLRSEAQSAIPKGLRFYKVMGWASVAPFL